jgi:hypothetical protein
MIRTLFTLSLVLACGIAAAETEPVQRIDEPLTMTSFGQLRKGGSRFNPVYTFQHIPAKARVAKKSEAKPAQKPEPATPAEHEGSGEVREL